MIELRFNGQPLPTTIGSGIQYTLQTLLNGAEVTPVQWSVSAGGSLLTSGNHKRIVFTPVIPQPHTVVARVAVEFGFSSVSAILNVVPKLGRAVAGVRWSKLVYAPGDSLTGTIVAIDSNGQPARHVSWNLTHNSNPLEAGTGTAVATSALSAGVVHLTGTATCFDGAALHLDSTVFVKGTANLRSSVPLPEPGGTMVYLGEVYTNTMAAPFFSSQVAPYQILSASQEVNLLPGCTHFTCEPRDIRDNQGQTSVPPEVVVRTKAGNWALNGPPDGLNGETIGYDYQIGSPMIPAPADLRAMMTVDAWAPRLYAGGPPGEFDVSISASNFQVRVKCYRQTSNVYKYTRCPYSNFPGGPGRRARRFAVLFTAVDVQADALSGLNRLGTGDAIVAYSTPEVGNIPMMTLATDGQPNPTPYKTGMFFTDSNNYACYESVGHPDIYAKAVAGIESLRPAYFTLMTFPNGQPLVVNRVKRVYGKLLLFLADGAVYEGETVTVTVYKSGSTSSQSIDVPVSQTVYVNEDAVCAQVGSVSIDLSDFQFDETGVLMDFEVHGQDAVSSSIPSGTDLVPAPQYIYSRQYLNGARLDGACYSNPQYVPIYDSDYGGNVAAILGCHDRVCGPTGIYCYSPAYGTGAGVLFQQPLGFPAPYAAFDYAPFDCYQLAGFVAVANGTEAGSHATVAYPDNGLCGSPYRYIRCDAAYSTVLANNAEIVVVYPPSASPHSAVEHQSECYYYAGTLSSYGTRPAVSSGSVAARLGCADYYCSGSVSSGSVAVYNDAESRLQVPVRFDQFAAGLPVFGVAPAKLADGANGLTSGHKLILFRAPVVPLFVAGGSGRVNFHVGLRGSDKSIVVEHGGVRSSVAVGQDESRIVPVQQGDTVYLSVADVYGHLPAHFQGLMVRVSWAPVIILPHLYDAATVVLDSPTPIRALGFCGYTDQSDYAFYGTLPVKAAMSGPVNPDSTVTVYNNGTEYLLVSATSPAEVNFTPVCAASYAGQSFSGTTQFRFYACRAPAGAHGEMDVWYNFNGTLPALLAVNPYRTLKLSGSYYTKVSDSTDTTRNAYSVASSVHILPRLYVSDAGRVISVCGTDAVISLNGTVFTQTGTDTGLSYTIMEPPSLGFTASLLSGSGSTLTTTFTNLSAGADRYSWDFGDGHTSGEVNPTHTYTVPGDYSPKLTAFWSGGTAEFQRMYYIYLAIPVPVITYGTLFAQFAGTGVNSLCTRLFYTLDAGAWPVSTVEFLRTRNNEAPVLAGSVASGAGIFVNTDFPDLDGSFVYTARYVFENVLGAWSSPFTVFVALTP